MDLLEERHGLEGFPSCGKYCVLLGKETVHTHVLGTKWPQYGSFKIHPEVSYFWSFPMSAAHSGRQAFSLWISLPLAATSSLIWHCYQNMSGNSIVP